MDEPIRIVAERSPRRFLAAQRAFYRDDPCFVPPIEALEAWQVDRAKNPFFEHAETELWLAWRGTELVGRVSATRDRLHDEFHGDRVGFFGHFEARDEASAHALLGHARAWLAARGATVLRGPVDLSTNYKCGLLVAGEPGLPVLMMPHNPPEYAGWLESFGLAKTKDLIAVRLHRDTATLDRLPRVNARISERVGATMRPIDVRRFTEDVELLWKLYNRIWEQNWGFVPMSRGEFMRQAKDLKGALRPELTAILYARGDPVAFVIGLPDISPAIRACNGRLLPFGWWKLLRAKRRVKLMRVITLGVVPEMRKSGVDALLLWHAIQNALAAGFDECDCSWILEDNELMLRALRALGARDSRRFRIYERAI